jgi:hypothetical protein
MRNLSLIERRMTPDFYTIVMAAKQTAGDQFALHVAETAREYLQETSSAAPRVFLPVLPWPAMTLGIGQGRFPDGDVVHLVSRLPGPPVEWRSFQLSKRPEKKDVARWALRWNPYSHRSWPPEDTSIESFRAHVFDRARAILGQDLARTEKFTTSVMDGIDIRDTLRHWYDGETTSKCCLPRAAFSTPS